MNGYLDEVHQFQRGVQRTISAAGLPTRRLRDVHIAQALRDGTLYRITPMVRTLPPLKGGPGNGPMELGDRTRFYRQQRHSLALTPRQQRRLRKKYNLAVKQGLAVKGAA